MSCSIKQTRLYSCLFVFCVLLSFIFSLFSYSFVSAISVNSYTYTFTDVQQNNIILYDPNGTNPYNFVPKYISLKTSSTQSCSYFATQNFRIYADFSLVNSIVNVKLLLHCDVEDPYYFNVENWTQYSSFTGFVVPAGDFKTYTTYTITVYDGDPTGVCPPCPECEDCNAPYSNVLHDILHAIFVIPATALVIYFFYCIYRMMIRSTGGRQ